MKRLESLDALRGFDMIFIMGGSSLVVAIAQLFPDSSIWVAIGEQMSHVSWDGLRHHDTIFPLFLFIAGISFPFSLNKQLENGKSIQDIYLKIIRRGLMLVFLGLVYNNLMKFEFDTLRFCSVLSRIGLGWMFGALIFTSVKSNRIRAALLPEFFSVTGSLLYLSPHLMPTGLMCSANKATSPVIWTGSYWDDIAIDLNTILKVCFLLFQPSQRHYWAC